jgi:hypothetical protein
MKRTAALLVFLVACGDDGGSPILPTGSFRLVAETVSGAATPEAMLNGALEVTATEYALGIARPAPRGVVASYTVSGDSIVLGGGGTVELGGEGDRITLRPDSDRSWTFLRFTPAPAETFPVTGTVGIARGAPPMTSPYAALLHYNRTVEGQVILAHDPRDAQPLDLQGGTASFDLSRARPALGTDRIPYPPGSRDAGISIALVVVFDDRDGSGELDDIFASCASPQADCIRGVSSIVLASRDGASAELAASPYALLRPGWTHAVQVTDQRSGKLGLASVDPDKALTHEITVVVDPAALAAPGFEL